jgi:thiamine-phosphate pyrophosphorylase
MSNVDFRLLLVTDRQVIADGELSDRIRSAAEAGVRAVQLREKDLSARELFELAVQLKRICDANDCRLLINDRIDVASALHAAGVHLPGNGIPMNVVKQHLQSNMLVGTSTHSTAEAIAASQAGLDYVVFGPVYETPSKVRYGKPLGLQTLAETAGSVDIPVFAIGGITPSRAVQCMQAGASGVALISAIMAATDPAVEVERFRVKMGNL